MSSTRSRPERTRDFSFVCIEFRAFRGNASVTLERLSSSARAHARSRAWAWRRGCGRRRLRSVKRCTIPHRAPVRGAGTAAKRVSAEDEVPRSREGSRVRACLRLLRVGEAAGALHASVHDDAFLTVEDTVRVRALASLASAKLPCAPRTPRRAAAASGARQECLGAEPLLVQLVDGAVGS